MKEKKFPLSVKEIVKGLVCVSRSVNNLGKMGGEVYLA